jgi:hypothetical protein
MGTYLLGLLFMFACLELFLILDGIGRPIVRALLNGPFNRFYLQYLRSSTKYEFETASAANNSDRAWSGVVFEKVYELGIAGIPYSKREKNLEYIKAEVSSKPQASRKLADELIKVLPRQYRNVGFQKKLACFICELLSRKEDHSHDSKTQGVKPIHSIAIDNLTTTVSAWMAGAVYLLLSLYVLDQYHPLFVIFSNFLLFILMIVPLFNLIGTRLAKFTTVGTIAALIVLFLGVFATIAHGRAQSPLDISLDPYQNPSAELTLRSPEWLTMSNINCDGKKISVTLRGQLTTPIRFHVNDEKFYLANKDCVEIVPQLEVTQTETQAYEFFVAARDPSPFYSGLTDVRIIPSYVSTAEEIDLNSSAVLSIRLEHWLWGLISSIYVTLGSIGGTILLYLVNYFINKRNP